MATIAMRKMKEGQKGIIKNIKATGELGLRIREMGLVKGAEIMIQGKAPLYDPVSLKIRDFNLTLRNSEADFIDVEV